VIRLAVLVSAFALLVGCGSDERGRGYAPIPTKTSAAPAERGAETVSPSHCPEGHPACRVTVGRIVYVERVDPDGDGDAHFVIRDPQGITLPGLTAIDVRAGLRPHPLPGPGELISAAGPVQTGSYGQAQIHALELHVAR
jgi:hypothetical protein